MDNEFNSYDFSDVVPEKETTIRNTKCCHGCTRHANKLHTYDWLHDFPEMQAATDRLKFSLKIRAKVIISIATNSIFTKAICCSGGFSRHDIGTVTLTGKLVELQMKKNNYREDVNGGVKRVYRIARHSDRKI
jgi:hypothetical protein